MPGIHFGIGQSHIAGIVAPDQREGHRNDALGQNAALGKIDPHIQRGDRTTCFSEPGDDGVFHGLQAPGWFLVLGSWKLSENVVSRRETACNIWY